MKQIAISLVISALVGTGCATQTGEIDYQRLTTHIEPRTYGEILCRGQRMLDKHTCVVAVMDHYRQTGLEPNAPGSASQRPLVLVLDDGTLLTGHYLSNPFAAWFNASNEQSQCRGRYSAFYGDTAPIFRIRCTDGRTATGTMILDLHGHNGLGEVTFDDGSSGDLVFGEAAVGGIL